MIAATRIAATLAGTRSLSSLSAADNARSSDDDNTREIAGISDFEYQHIVISDLLRFRDRGVPVDRAGEWHEVIVVSTAVVMHVGGPQISGNGLDRFPQVAHQVRMPVIQAHAHIDPVELVLDQTDERRRAGQRIRNYFHRDLHPNLGGHHDDVLKTTPRGVRPIVAGRWLLGGRHSEMHDQKAVRDAAGDLERRAGLRQGSAAACFVARRVRERADPSAVSDAIEDWRVQRMELQAGVRQPVRQPADCLFVVVIEMRTCGEQFDRVESVRGNAHEVLSRESRVVKQVGRYAETVVSQTTILQGCRLLAPGF